MHRASVFVLAVHVFMVGVWLLVAALFHIPLLHHRAERQMKEMEQESISIKKSLALKEAETLEKTKQLVNTTQQFGRLQESSSALEAILKNLKEKDREQVGRIEHLQVVVAQKQEEILLMEAKYKQVQPSNSTLPVAYHCVHSR